MIRCINELTEQTYMIGLNKENLGNSEKDPIGERQN